MNVIPHDFRRQWEETRQDVLRAVERVGASGYYILGTEVSRFEKQLAQYWGLPEAIGVANGMDALEIGLRAMGLRAGDRVLTTPFSAFATTLAIARAGGIPIFADVDESGLIDLTACRRILEKDRSIRFMIPVHLYGHALNLDQLRSLRDDFELKIVEDCAQSIGAAFGKAQVGSVGQVTATSFYPTKNLGAIGDGGAILTADPELASIIRSLRDYGQSQKYVHSRLGLNSRLDELQAAILGEAFLPRLDAWTRSRSLTAERYLTAFKTVSKVQPLPVPANSRSVWHLFPVIVTPSQRQSFQDHLREQGVLTNIHYPILISDQEALNELPEHHSPEPLKKASELARSVVSLPIHPFLQTAEIERVISAISSWHG